MHLKTIKHNYWTFLLDDVKTTINKELIYVKDACYIEGCLYFEWLAKSKRKKH